MLLDALVELGFMSKKSPNLRNMRTSSKNILLTGKEQSNIIQENLYKVLCAILNLFPTQQQGGHFDDNLLVTYLDSVMEADAGDYEYFGVIKNLINRQAFQFTELQTYLVSSKFYRFANNYTGKFSDHPKAEFRDFDQSVRERQNKFISGHYGERKYEDWKEVDREVKDAKDRNAHLYFEKRTSSLGHNTSEGYQRGNMNQRSNSRTNEYKKIVDNFLEQDGIPQKYLEPSGAAYKRGNYMTAKSFNPNQQVGGQVADRDDHYRD